MFKGIDTLIAISFIIELGDFRRFMTASEFMSFLGLVPSEKPSGNKRRQGSSTKAGNSHIRKLLTCASWHYRSYKSSKRPDQRRKGMSRELISYADKAGNRLSKKSGRLLFSKFKISQIAAQGTGRFRLGDDGRSDKLMSVNPNDTLKCSFYAHNFRSNIS